METELQPVSVQRPGSRAAAGALSASVRPSAAAAMRSLVMTSAYDEGVARRDPLVEVVHDGQHAAVAAALEAPQREAVPALVQPAALHRAPRGALQRVPDGRRLVQQEADRHPVAGPSRP